MSTVSAILHQLPFRLHFTMPNAKGVSSRECGWHWRRWVAACPGDATFYGGRNMTQRILLFPGQGSQYLGMGKKLAESHAGAKRILDEANSVLGFDLADIMWNGPEEKLTATENTQPALFTVSMMAMEWVRERGVEFSFTAGHSLGEYSALCAAGAFS